MLISENDYYKLTYEEDLKILTITWAYKNMSLDEYKLPFEKAIEFMDTKPVDNYISDVRKQGIISPSYRNWLQDVGIPTAAQKGVKRLVGVTEANAFKRYYINNVFNSAKKFGMPFKMFKTIEKAKEWFKSFND